MDYASACSCLCRTNGCIVDTYMSACKREVLEHSLAQPPLFALSTPPSNVRTGRRFWLRIAYTLCGDTLLAKKKQIAKLIKIRKLDGIEDQSARLNSRWIFRPYGNWDMGMGQLRLERWGIYHLMLGGRGLRSVGHLWHLSLNGHGMHWEKMLVVMIFTSRWIKVENVAT